MRIKYSPIKWNEYAQLPGNQDTQIEYVDENTLRIDGEEYVFDPESVEWPEIAKETNGVILEARRDEAGELWLVVRRFYHGPARPAWDTGEFHTVAPTENVAQKTSDKVIILKGKTREQVEQERLDRLASEVRAERNRFLAETDYLVMPDYQIPDEEKEAWRQYRQALRDVPQQEGFPEKVVWPEKPGGKGIADG